MNEIAERYFRYTSMKNPFLSDLCWLGQAILHDYYRIHVIRLYIPNWRCFTFRSVIAVRTAAPNQQRKNFSDFLFLSYSLFDGLIYLDFPRRNVFHIQTQEFIFIQL